jgi:choline dehydrogenase-like flavoprotein
LDLAQLESGQELEADLVIIGGGPAGLTIAREFFGHSTQVLILESGRIDEDSRISELNTVESIGEPRTNLQIERRVAFHGASAGSWSHAAQPYGVRCRVLGGSSHAWAGKSAAFESIDFERRPWIEHTGWPISFAELAPHIDRAADRLNLGPNVYDDRLWALIGRRPPEPQLNPDLLRSFFWQFARSRIDQMDLMRFGPEFVREHADNVRVLLNATVTRIVTDAGGTSFESVEVACLEGARARVRGRAAVLAASGIENPRLLLASNQVRPAGIGNEHDVVGRYLLDHPNARVAHFGRQDALQIVKRFGFHGVSHRGRMHMYMHGLALPRAIQEREGLLNCALYMMEQRAPDDPFDALKRLLRRTSHAPLSDAFAVAKSPGLMAKGLGMKAFQSKAVPEWLKTSIVDTVIRINPNFVAREHLSGGTPHKLIGMAVEAISEQRPDPESRITLSEAKDPLGVPRAKIDWKVDAAARRSLLRLGQLMASEFPRVGLPAPALEDWVAAGRCDDAVVIDMAHTMGTTRMSDDPKQGVIDRNCRVHGMAGLYVAGASAFPTSSHVNPTLMILALAIRLADHLKQQPSNRQWPRPVAPTRGNRPIHQFA